VRNEEAGRFEFSSNVPDSPVFEALEPGTYTFEPRYRETRASVLAGEHGASSSSSSSLSSSSSSSSYALAGGQGVVRASLQVRPS